MQSDLLGVSAALDGGDLQSLHVWSALDCFKRVLSGFLGFEVFGYGKGSKAAQNG